MTTNNSPAPVALTCSECGKGKYYRFFNFSPIFECEECGHPLSMEDVELEAGESVTTTEFGALAYVSATEDDPLAFLEDADVTHGTVEDVRWGYESARRAHGDDYADYLIERDAEYTSKGLRLTPWPLSLAGNDGE